MGPTCGDLGKSESASYAHRPEAAGGVEVEVARLQILSRAEPSPFPLDRRDEVDEVTRLRHRYVDLRSEKLQRNLTIRAKVNSAIRRAMERQGFTEIETPMLIASTPEGARDFVVPSRLHPGAFYALPQSPQVFKQLCMVGGIDRYFQIARCFRDRNHPADVRIKVAITAVAIDRERQSFAGSFDTDHRSVRTRRDHGVAPDELIVLPVNPLLRGDVGRGQQLF